MTNIKSLLKDPKVRALIRESSQARNGTFEYDSIYAFVVRRLPDLSGDELTAIAIHAYAAYCEARGRYVKRAQRVLAPTGGYVTNTLTNFSQRYDLGKTFEGKVLLHRNHVTAYLSDYNRVRVHKDDPRIVAAGGSRYLIRESDILEELWVDGAPVMLPRPVALTITQREHFTGRLMLASELVRAVVGINEWGECEWGYINDETAVYSEYQGGRAFATEELAVACGMGWSEGRGTWWPLGDRWFAGEPPRAEELNAGYHNLNRRVAEEPQAWGIGVEIEKEDAEARAAHPWRPLYNRMGWCKENDSSLDSYSGYELVSPTFDLFKDTLFEHLEDKVLAELVDASYSQSCGGHIHLSKVGTDGPALLDRVAGYLPLLYALYPSRTERSYCRAKGPDALKSDEEKMQAVRVLSDRIEFRIFPAVRSRANLRWRVGLLRLMAAQSCYHPIHLLPMLEAGQPLHTHLQEAIGERGMRTLPDRVSRWVTTLGDTYYNSERSEPDYDYDEDCPREDEDDDY